MKKMSVMLCRACVVVAGCLCLSAFSDPLALRWDPSVAGTTWNATATNWRDAAESAVAWQPGAEAIFAESSGGLVDVAEDVAAAKLTFTGNGYTLWGAGRLTVTESLSAASATTNRIDAALRSATAAGLVKFGAGQLTFGHPNATLVNPVAVNEGTLALQNAALRGAVSIAPSATLAVLPPATDGLMGFYYDAVSESIAFITLATMEAHFASLTPALAAPSSLAGETFDFGSTGALFPQPYGSAGSRNNDFEVVWRGLITAPSAGYYTFRFTHDDGIVFAIDRKMLMNRLESATTETTVYLDTEAHDLVLGYYQKAGGCKLRVEVKELNGAFQMLPNAWLTPYSAVGQLSGSGTLALTDGAAFNVVQRGGGVFTGKLSGLKDALFSKTDPFNLTLASTSVNSNAFAGSVSIRAGSLTINAPERIGDTAALALAGESTLRLVADETLGSLTGAGTVAIGGVPSSVNVYAFNDDADCGISTSKTYTHLLDFPDTCTPATVNDVPFIAAGMSGSANGYSWSTINPPPGKWNAVDNTGITRVLLSFVYASYDYTTTLSGLTPGQFYETRLYFVGTGDPNSTRKVTFAFTAGAVFVGSHHYSLDTFPRSIVSARYQADAAGTLSIHVLSHHHIDTCHLYGLSNEEIAAPSLPPEPALVTNPVVVAFNGDADSGISSLKTYTHLLDFPNNDTAAIVNGVGFSSAAMSGSAGGYAWSTINPPPSGWDDEPSSRNRQGVDRLLWDFYYGSTDYTITLTGLYPGQSYETRLYFRSFSPPAPNAGRDFTCTFTAGAVDFGSVYHDQDTMARSMVRCRYTADAAGTLAVRVVSHNPDATCHISALSNEAVSTTPPKLTLNTPSGVDIRHTGAIIGSGSLTKRGTGTQRLGSTISLASPLDLQTGTLVLEAGTSVPAGAVVQAGATLEAPFGDVRLGWIGGSGALKIGNVQSYLGGSPFRTVYFTDDIGTGISSAKTYTHLLDFGTHSPTATINGVAFTKVQSSNGSANGYGWVNFPPNAHDGNPPMDVPVGSGIYNLLYDMDFGWSETNTIAKNMQLTGLVPGQRYEVRFYNRSWGGGVGGTRTQTLAFGLNGDGPFIDTISFNPDDMLPNYVGYRYTAITSVLNISVLSMYWNASYHIYGLSNEEIDGVTFDLAQECTFAGTLTGAGGWAKAGPATLVLSGSSAATGPVTVMEGKLAVDLTGTLGGDMTLASNALLQAGSETACGTLAVGGDLLLMPGALLDWRYTATEADLITVGGTLTFPTNGILQITALTSGVRPPALRPLIVAQHPIIGPADLTGWSVAGQENASLKYSNDRKSIYFHSPCGTLIIVR